MWDFSAFTEYNFIVCKIKENKVKKGKRIKKIISREARFGEVCKGAWMVYVRISSVFALMNRIDGVKRREKQAKEKIICK